MQREKIQFVLGIHTLIKKMKIYALTEGLFTLASKASFFIYIYFIKKSYIIYQLTIHINSRIVAYKKVDLILLSIKEDTKVPKATSNVKNVCWNFSLLGKKVYKRPLYSKTS